MAASLTAHARAAVWAPPDGADPATVRSRALAGAAPPRLGLPAAVHGLRGEGKNGVGISEWVGGSPLPSLFRCKKCPLPVSWGARASTIFPPMHPLWLVLGECISRPPHARPPTLLPTPLSGPCPSTVLLTLSNVGGLLPSLFSWAIWCLAHAEVPTQSPHILSELLGLS